MCHDPFSVATWVLSANGEWVGGLSCPNANLYGKERVFPLCTIIETVFRVSGYTFKGTVTYEHVSFPPGLKSWWIQDSENYRATATLYFHCTLPCVFSGSNFMTYPFMMYKKEAFSVKVVAVGILLIRSFIYITFYWVLLVCFDVINRLGRNKRVIFFFCVRVSCLFCEARRGVCLFTTLVLWSVAFCLHVTLITCGWLAFSFL